MFADHEVLLNVSFPVAHARLAGLVRRGFLIDASDEAYADGLTGLMRVGPFGSSLGTSKLVRVHLLAPFRRGDSVVLALRWEATGITGRLFPVLDGDLVLTAAADDTTRLSLTGAYRPPLAGLGAGLDRLVLHRAASATVRSLLDRVADALADLEPEPVLQHGLDGVAACPPRLRIQPNGSG